MYPFLFLSERRKLNISLLVLSSLLNVPYHAISTDSKCSRETWMILKTHENIYNIPYYFFISISKRYKLTLNLINVIKDK